MRGRPTASLLGRHLTQTLCHSPIEESMRKILIVAGILIAIALYSTVYFNGYRLIYFNHTKCDNLYELAQNNEKLNYMRNWIGKNLQGAELLGEFGYSGNISSLDNPTYFQKLKIDWEYLGLKQENASVHIYRESKDQDDLLNPKNILSVSFGQGRDSIILKINDSDNFGFPDNKVFHNKLKYIDNKVAVRCD